MNFFNFPRAFLVSHFLLFRLTYYEIIIESYFDVQLRNIKETTKTEFRSTLFQIFENANKIMLNDIYKHHQCGLKEFCDA